jgi:hypothetical protein
MKYLISTLEVEGQRFGLTPEVVTFIVTCQVPDVEPCLAGVLLLQQVLQQEKVLVAVDTYIAAAS